MQPKYGSTSLCDQNCGLQSEDRQKDTWTDKSLKTDGPMILSNDIFFFKTVIIGGPIISVAPINKILYFISIVGCKYQVQLQMRHLFFFSLNQSFQYV